MSFFCLLLVLTANTLLIIAAVIPINDDTDVTTKDVEDSSEIEIFSNLVEDQFLYSKDAHYAMEIERMAQRSWLMHLGEPDLSSGDMLVEQLRLKPSARPEELGTYLEGDILFPSSTVQKARNGALAEFRWPEAKIYYLISSSFDLGERKLILKAMQNIERHTCVSFQPKKSGQRDGYVYITGAPMGCFSAVGYQKQEQLLNLQHGACVNERTITHELMHTLGFFHEHSRADRNNYISVKWENILSKNVTVNFKRVHDSDFFGLPYDYDSTMHYSRYAFSKDYGNKPTIVYKTPYNEGTRAQYNGLSCNDIRKINTMYKCNIVIKCMNVTCQ